MEALEASAPAAFLEAVGGRVGGPVPSLREPGWSRPIRSKQGAPVFDLRADPGPWLLRMLLACSAERAGFLVDNNHPDITSERAQHALAEVVSAKYRLRFHRSSPDSKHAIVVADLMATPSVAGYLLHRAHGKVGNIWREALITHAEADLTKREAKERVSALAPNAADLELRLIDLPRHRIAEVLRSATR